jgi:hypothetical protein
MTDNLSGVDDGSWNLSQILEHTECVIGIVNTLIFERMEVSTLE